MQQLWLQLRSTSTISANRGPHRQSKRDSAAQARIESQPVCIRALETSDTAIRFDGKGEVKAKDCVIWSNSRSNQSVDFNGRGKVESERLCTAGRSANPGQYEVKPGVEERCQQVKNPMRAWTPPAVQPCDYTSTEWRTGMVVHLDPGVYCGGLRVDAKKVFMRPGLYVVKDGPLRLRAEKEIKGEGIGILLSGADTKVEMDSDAKIDVTAMETTEMAGIVLAADPSNPPEESTITGRTDLKVGGVLYLPQHNLTYWGDSDTRAASPVTTLIANQITIGGEAFLEVKNDKDKAKYAPVLETGQGDVILIK